MWRYLLYMDMAVIFVMRPRYLKQTYVSPTHGNSTSKLASICQARWKVIVIYMYTCIAKGQGSTVPEVHCFHYHNFFVNFVIVESFCFKVNVILHVNTWEIKFAIHKVMVSQGSSFTSLSICRT